MMAEWVSSCMVHSGSMSRNDLLMFHTTKLVHKLIRSIHR